MFREIEVQTKVDIAVVSLRVHLAHVPQHRLAVRAEVDGPVEDAELLGQTLGDDLLAQGADAILASTK